MMDLGQLRAARELDQAAADSETPPDEKPTEAEPQKAGKQKKTVKSCASCGRVKPVVSRGLCGACYPRHKKAGTLDQLYPAKPTSRKPVADDPVLEKSTAPVMLQPAEKSRMPYLEDAAEIVAPQKTDNCIARLTLRFFPRDKALYQDIIKSAEFNRRALSAEILFRLEYGVA